ncbi:MAG: transposase, partial [Firmicutes bacterium]|nr:transposase [Bacillota bacterium]
MIYGFLESNSVHLSNISRGLNENISLKKTIDRLSRNLKNFDETFKINENYIKEISSFINDDTIFCVDGSEIVKHHTKSFESLDRVRDGNTGKIKDGYNIFEI